MTSTSTVQICNLALVYLGQDETIEALTDQDSRAAILCNLVYDHARDFVLADHAWNFARVRKTLTELENDSEGWGYRYRYPLDCLQALYLIDAEAADYGDMGLVEVQARQRRIPFVTAGDDAGGRVIYTDQAEAVLAYTRRVEEPGQYPPHFIEALAWHVAARIAYPLSGRAEDASRAREGYTQAKIAAAAADANEGAPPPAPAPATVRARLNG